MGMEKNKKKHYAALLILVMLAAAFYMHAFDGINTDYDDFGYAYFVANPFPLPQVVPYAGAFGFLVDLPLYYITGNSLALVTVSGLVPVLLAMLFLFWVCDGLGRPAYGLLAAALFAFNPLTYTYAPHMLPDSYITLALSISLVLSTRANLAKGRKAAAMMASSGFAAALGLLFGAQALVTILCYCVMLAAMAATGRRRMPVLYGFAGVAIGLLLYALPQYAAYGSPIFPLAALSKNLQAEAQGQQGIQYYMYVAIPELFGMGSVNYSTAPPTNLGALFVISLLSVAGIAAHARESRLSKGADTVMRGYILPYSAAGLAFLLYLLFGTSSIFSYVQFEHLNRLVIPATVFFSLAAALSISLVRKDGPRRAALLATLAATAAATTYYVVTLAQYYGAFHAMYSAISTMPAHLAGVDTGSYSLVYNYSLVSTAACFELGITPGGCEQLLPGGHANMSRPRTIFILDSPAAGMAYYYHNGTYGYYVYINNSTAGPRNAT